MPNSKGRHAAKHPHHHPKKAGSTGVAHKAPSRIKATTIATAFFAFLGLGIGFFIDGSSVVAIGAGTVLGAFAGYLFGRQIDNSITSP